MANALLTKVWEKDHGVRDCALMVLLVIADHSNREGVCWPSVGTIAKLCRATDRHVQRIMRGFEEAGLLRKRDRDGKSNVYEIVVEKLDSFPDLFPPVGVTSRPPLQNVGGDIQTTRGGGLETTRGVTSRPPITVIEPIIEPKKAEAPRESSPKKTKTSKVEETLPLPPLILNTAQFLDVWESWVSYRRNRKMPMTAVAAKIMFAKLERWGHDAAITALETAICNNWQGPFEPKSDNNGFQRRRDNYQEPIYTEV